MKILNDFEKIVDDPFLNEDELKNILDQYIKNNDQLVDQHTLRLTLSRSKQKSKGINEITHVLADTTKITSLLADTTKVISLMKKN